MIRISRQNLAHLNSASIGLLLADARVMPLSEEVSVATDQPYGRTSSTHRIPVKQLVEDFFNDAIDAPVTGEHISMALPSSCPIDAIGIDKGYNFRKAHRVKVHKNLIRLISVLRKP